MAIYYVVQMSSNSSNEIQGTHCHYYISEDLVISHIEDFHRLWIAYL